MFYSGYYDKEFSTRHMMESNPFNSMVMINGLIAPISTLPEDLQKMVREARAKGEDIEFSTK